MRDLRPSAIYYARFSQGGDSGNGAGRSVATTTRPRDRTKPDADTVTIGDGKSGGRRVFLGRKVNWSKMVGNGMIRQGGRGLKHSWQGACARRAMLFGRNPDRGQMGEKMVRGNEGRVCNAQRGGQGLRIR